MFLYVVHRFSVIYIYFYITKRITDDKVIDTNTIDI